MTMNKINTALREAIVNGIPMMKGNTAVIWDGDDYTLILHGQAIAAGSLGHSPSAVTLGNMANLSTAYSRLQAIGADIRRKGNEIVACGGGPVDPNEPVCLPARAL